MRSDGPALSSIGPVAGTISPGIIGALRRDRLVDGDELGAVGEGGLDLHLVDHLGDAVHHVVAGQHLRPASIRSATVRPSRAPSSTNDGEDGDRLGVVELQPAGAAVAGDLGGHVDEQPLLLVR